MKLRRVVAGDGSPYGWAHHCPGCGHTHVIVVEGTQGNGHRWSFDGDEASPTFSPSVNCSWGPYGDPPRERRCHYFLRAGRIEFCADSTHALAGRTVELPELPG